MPRKLLFKVAVRESGRQDAPVRDVPPHPEAGCGMTLHRFSLATGAGWGARLAGLALAAGLVVGCASETALRFQCDPVVNDGILLTVDLVQVNEAEAAQIRQEGVRWFYSTLRQTLSMRRKTVAVERGKCPQRVLLQPEKGYEILAVVADYRSAPSDRVDGYMQFRTRKEWKGRTLDIAVRGVYLTVEPGR